VFGVLLNDLGGRRGPLAELALTADDPVLRQRAAVLLTARSLAWLARKDEGAGDPTLPPPVRDFFRALRAWYADERQPAGEPVIDIEHWWRTQLAPRPRLAASYRWQAVAGCLA
jgi:hypothetical protein